MNTYENIRNKYEKKIAEKTRSNSFKITHIVLDNCS